MGARLELCCELVHDALAHAGFARRGPASLRHMPCCQPPAHGGGCPALVLLWVARTTPMMKGSVLLFIGDSGGPSGPAPAVFLGDSSL